MTTAKPVAVTRGWRSEAAVTRPGRRRHPWHPSRRRLRGRFEQPGGQDVFERMRLQFQQRIERRNIVEKVWPAGGERFNECAAAHGAGHLRPNLRRLGEFVAGPINQ